MTLTPDSSRLHIVFAGERNSGKSSLLNALARQQVSIVSDIPGTTTDCVSKAMELPGLGPCTLIDTAGLDDSSELGGQRIGKAEDALKTADIVIGVIDAATGIIPDIPHARVPVIPVLNKCDRCSAQSVDELSEAIKAKTGKEPVRTSANRAEGVKELIAAVQESLPEDWDAPLLTADLVKEGALVVLVMPQDTQAPKGRLILPQQQVLRELLDRGCRAVCCTAARLKETLETLKKAPDVVITDASYLAEVHASLPAGVSLTSFSMLLAAAKGDMAYFKKSAERIGSLKPSSKVLIAEACTHVPAGEDIGRVKIPRLLRSAAGEDLQIDVVSGRDFPADLRAYDLVIHCGACMFNRRYVLARVEQAKSQGVPMTNYGTAIAYIDKLL